MLESKRPAVAHTIASADHAPHYASAITTLADVYCYQPSDRDRDRATITPSGDVQPAKTQRKSFPRALKRLRDRLRVLEERLVLDTNALQQEVMNVELQKTLLTKKLRDRDARVHQGAVDVVNEYFEVFQYGWMLPSTRTRDDAATQSRSHARRMSARELCGDDPNAALSERQRRFLHTAVDAATVRDLASHWQSLSQIYESPRLLAQHIECVGAGDAPIVIARASFVAGLTYDTLRWSYPSALEDHRLAQRLIGERVEYPCRVTCSVTSSGIICRHELELDHVLALRRVLCDLGQVERVLRPVQNRETERARYR